ncbi:Sterile alpha motif domain-containing protein 3 [Merluccius polli]|uniref:Sterile alpha motif domain-containing protein 3 n=1 Tax=Merluccius polli TaxID=89951 RepID=A0AA47P7M4_MERPO|nr:Sterile alpha motif domain-containing protein 3 [Merluccius polli]
MERAHHVSLLKTGFDPALPQRPLYPTEQALDETYENLTKRIPTLGRLCAYVFTGGPLFGYVPIPTKERPWLFVGLFLPNRIPTLGRSLRSLNDRSPMLHTILQKGTEVSVTQFIGHLIDLTYNHTFSVQDQFKSVMQISFLLSSQALLLLIHINPKLVRKIRLTKAPETLEELYNELRQKLQLVGEFCIQYEDPDFGQAVCNLIDIAELPSEKAVLHILWSNEDIPSPSPPQPPTPSRSSSISSLDTASIGSPDSIHSVSSVVRTYRRNVSQWPTPFPVPAFSYDVELILRKGNDMFERTGKNIFAVKAYPETHEYESVAAELVNKHPCLKDPGGGTGYAGWTTSIKYKIGNYRSKLRQAGCNEVGVNRRIRTEEEDDHGANRRRRDDGDGGPEARFSLKKPKRGEVNHVPDHPENYTEDDLEDLRSSLVEAMKKKNKDMEFIRQRMDITFSLRRKQIVEVEPMVSEVLERWPGLFLEEQIGQEFTRVTTKDLMGTFGAALEMFTPRLLKLYRARKGAFSRDMETLLERLDEQTSDITRHRRQAAVEGLPIFLRENTEKLFPRCLATDADDQQSKGIKMGVLTVLDDDDAIIDIALVLEEAIVLKDISDTPTALAYLFGLLYALNMEFPKELKYTFETIQHIFMEMSTNCSQRVRSFKTKLLCQ